MCSVDQRDTGHFEHECSTRVQHTSAARLSALSAQEVSPLLAPRLPLSPGVAGGQRDRQQVNDLLGDQHHRLMRMRLEGLEGIEVGPSLGRGSYGRVYKGARCSGASLQCDCLAMFSLQCVAKHEAKVDRKHVVMQLCSRC